MECLYLVVRSLDPSWTRDFSPASVAVVLLVWPALFAMVLFGPMGLIAVAAIPVTIWMGIRLSRLLSLSGNAHELRPCLMRLRHPLAHRTVSGPSPNDSSSRERKLMPSSADEWSALSSVDGPLGNGRHHRTQRSVHSDRSRSLTSLRADAPPTPTAASLRPGAGAHDGRSLRPGPCGTSAP